MKNSSGRWRRLTVTPLAVVAVGAMLLTGCTGPSTPSGPSTDEKPIVGGNLTIQISSDPGGLDQAVYPSIETVNISELIFEKLFALDNQNKPHPMLVDTYDVSKDGTVYTFKLRKGIQFSDGTPMTSADVVASLDYWMRVQQYGISVKPSVVSMEAPDDLTVVITLTGPRYPFISELTGVGTAILKKDIAESLTAKGFANDQVIGTGPYKLKTWDVNEQLVVERNDLYKSLDKEMSGYAGAKHAYLDSITFKIVADTDAVKNGLLTGQWLYASPTPDAYPELKANPDLVVHTLTGGNLNLLILNHTYPDSIFSKPEARDALNLAIDKKAIMAATGGSPDLTVESGSLTPKVFATTYSTAGDDEYNAYDPEKAKKLFEEAGYTDDKPIQILTTNAFPTFYQWSTLIQDQLSKIGIKSDIRAYDFTTMLAQLQGEPDKWDFVPIFFNGAFPTPGQMNVLQGAVSPDVTEALADYNKVTSEDEAHEIMNKLTKYTWRDKPDLILGTTTPYAAYSPKLKGYDNYWYVFWNSWISK